MEYRTGKCSQCGAEYKIPASFAHNVARCKVCRGVVHVSGGAGPSAGPRREARESTRSEAREPAPSARAASGPPGEAAPAPARTTPPAPPAREPVGAPASRGLPAASEPAAPVAAARSGLPVPLLVVGAVLVLAAAGLFFFRARIFGAERAPAAETATPADQ